MILHWRRHEPDSSQGQEYKKFNREEQIEIGKIGFVRVDEFPVDDDSEEDESRSDLLRKVALIRDPGMVVAYWSPQNYQSHLDWVAAYKADSEIDHKLTLSEPPAHHAWEDNAERLLSEFPDGKGARIVKTTKARIKGTIGKWLRDAKPNKSPSARSSILDRLYGSLFRVPGRSTVIGPHVRDPFHIERPETRCIGNRAELKVTARRKLKLDREYRESTLKVRYMPEVRICEDMTMSKSNDAVPIESLGVLTSTKCNREGDWLVFDLTKDEAVEIEFLSAGYDGRYVVAIDDRIEKYAR